MKTTLTLISALIGGIVLPTLTFAGQTADGCATVQSPKGNWSIVADADACATKTGGSSIYVDTDDDGTADSFDNSRDN